SILATWPETARLEPATGTSGAGTFANAIQPPSMYVGFPKLPTYFAMFRLAARPYALSFAMGANTRKQFAVLSGPAVNTLLVKLLHCWVAVESSSVAAIIMADLVQTVNLPATGNPTIAISAADRNDPIVSMTAMALPGTPSTEFATISSTEWNLGITGAASVANPPPPLTWVDLLAVTFGIETDPFRKSLRVCR